MTDSVDFVRINMLLDIVHNSIDVPGLDLIRSEAMEELKVIERELFDAKVAKAYPPSAQGTFLPFGATPAADPEQSRSTRFSNKASDNGK